MKHNVLTIRTSEKYGDIALFGESEDWPLNAGRAIQCSHVIFCQRHRADHGEDGRAFLVGRMSGLRRATNGRFIVMISHYALLENSSATFPKKNQNSILYRMPDDSDIDFDALEFEVAGDMKDGAVLTVDLAKNGLAKFYKCDEESITINLPEGCTQ